MNLNLKYNCLLFLGFILLFSDSKAQDLINIKHFSTADGLSDNKVTTIIKDRDGFMWFGSWAGINRFDGYNFITFKSYPGDESSLKSNRIDDIVEDKQAGFLWVKAYDNQIYRFDKRSQKYTALPDLLRDDNLKKVFFSRILAVVNNEVWLQSNDQGIFLIEDALGAYPSYKKYNDQQDFAHQIPSNKINFFHLDKSNQVWIGTSSGISVFSKSQECDYKKVKSPDLFKMNFSGFEESENCMWLAFGGQVFIIERNTKKITSYHITIGEITGLKVSKTEHEMFCTTSLGEIFAIKENGEKNLLGSTEDHSPLYTIFEDSENNLWIGAEKYGIVSFDRKTKKLSGLLPYKNYKFSAWNKNFTIFENNSTVWVALNEYGLGFYDRKKQIIQKIDVESFAGNKKLRNLILRSYYDSNGILWLVSDYGGIEKVIFQEYDFTQTYLQRENELKSKNEVRGILADEQNRLWVGTKSAEIYVYKDGEKQESPFVKEIPFKSGIYCMFKDREGAMWFGTKTDGLFKAVPEKNGKFSLAKHFFEKEVTSSAPGINAIYNVMQDRKGRIWAGSYGGGLILLQKPEANSIVETIDNSFKYYPKGNYKRIRCLAEDAAGRIWIATTEGLVIFNPNDGLSENYQFRIYRKEPGNLHSLGGNDVQFIYKDAKGRMWVLTSSGGLNLAIGKDPLHALTFQNFSTKNGLPSDFLLSCTEDEEANLWIATENGVTKFSTLTHKFQNFNHYDGLYEEASFSESSCVRMPDGRIAFGSTAGFLSFNPQSIRSKKIGANMVFTNIQINGEDIFNTEKSPLKEQVAFANYLKLKHDQNIITIDFAVLDFHAIDKMNFACRILGFDNVWRNTGHQRTITYTNLPPGDYVFQVKSLNDELYKQLPFKSLKITIAPPIWKTWWAYTLYTLLVISVLILVQRVIYTMLKLRHRIELEKKLADLKLNFFTQISHELRTPLSLIVNPMEEVLHNESLSTKGKGYVKLVLKNAQRMTRLINQLLDLRKVQSGKASMRLQEMELLAFTKNLISYFQDTIAKRNLSVNVLTEHEQVNTYWDTEKVEIVIYNLLANAIKFSPDGGVVNVNIAHFDYGKWCKIEVIDHGSGVLDDELQNIFNIYYEGKNKADGSIKSSGIGLALAKELVELHGGEIYAENIPNGGFKVVVKLPCLISSPLLDINETGANVLKSTYQEQWVEDEGELDFQPENATNDSLSKILIVEDNEDLRNFLVAKFAEIYKVEIAVNGEEGLQKAIETLPDMIISDIMMPKMDGVQMLNKLKHNSLTSHIPIILLTAKNSVETHIQSLNYGADYYLSKPFNMKLLSTAMSSILIKRSKVFQSVLKGNIDGIEYKEVAEHMMVAQDRDFLQKTIQIVKEQLDNPDFNIDDVADTMNMSRSSFFKKFKSLTNLAPVEFVRDTRLERGKEMLEEGSKNISEVAYSIGFSNPKYFSTCFKARYNQSPSEYLKENNSTIK